MEKNRHQTISDTPKAAYRAARPTKRIEPTKPFPGSTTQPPVKKIKRVAAYARVSSDHEEQESSYVLQCEHYENYIKNHEGWTLIKVYADADTPYGHNPNPHKGTVLTRAFPIL